MICLGKSKTEVTNARSTVRSVGNFEQETLFAVDENVLGIHMINVAAAVEAVYGSQQKRKGGIDLDTIRLIREQVVQGVRELLKNPKRCAAGSRARGKSARTEVAYSSTNEHQEREGRKLGIRGGDQAIRRSRVTFRFLLGIATTLEHS